MNDERQVALEIRSRFASRCQQLTEWRRQTDKSDRAFYRRLAEATRRDGTG